MYLRYYFIGIQYRDRVGKHKNISPFHPVKQYISILVANDL